MSQAPAKFKAFYERQIEFLANIVRLWRGDDPEFTYGSDELLLELFPGKRYQDVAGRCGVADPSAIEAQGWSLNPGRYVGVHAGQADDVEFVSELERLQEEFSTLTAQASVLAEVVESAFDKALRP